MTGFQVTPIGRVESALTDPTTAPKQGPEGAPDAWLVIEAVDGTPVVDLKPELD